MPVSLEDGTEGDLYVEIRPGAARLRADRRDGGAPCLSAVADLAFLVDSERRYLDITPSVTRGLGITLGDLSGRRLGALSRDGDPATSAIWIYARDNGVATGSHSLVAADGREIKVSYQMWSEFVPGVTLIVARLV